MVFALLCFVLLFMDDVGIKFTWANPFLSSSSRGVLYSFFFCFFRRDHHLKMIFLAIRCWVFCSSHLKHVFVPMNRSIIMLSTVHTTEAKKCDKQDIISNPIVRFFFLLLLLLNKTAQKLTEIYFLFFPFFYLFTQLARQPFSFAHKQFW